MRLVKELVLRAWHARRAEVGREIAETERRANGVQQKLDRLDEAFLFTESIDLQTYERQRDRLRPELTPIDIGPTFRPDRETRCGGHSRVRRTLR
jgi:hypothetical protein